MYAKCLQFLSVPFPPPPQHTEVQLSLAKAEKSYFETKLKLDRVSGERQSLLGENRSLEAERDDLRPRLRRLTEENADIKDKCVPCTKN